ncbi:MAG: hypothetical protein WD042_01325 [Phycisphaeraceae bacterium]
MWIILEHPSVDKARKKAPESVAKKYELWKELVREHGPEKVREFPGFHDEKLKGVRRGQRSSRLNLQYRVIYTIAREIVTVFVLEVTPHQY